MKSPLVPVPLVTLASLLVITSASPTPAQHKLSLDSTTDDICLRICWQFPPTCRDGWYSNNMGTGDNPCWTCCKAPYDVEVKSMPPIDAEQICLKLHLPTPPPCWEFPPQNIWYSVNKGTEQDPAWTCCRAIPDDDSDVMEIEASVKTHVRAANSDVTVSVNVHENKAFVDPFCLDVCWPEEEECPYGWNKNKGSDDDPCWACCRGSYDEMAAPKVSTTVVDPLCLDVCWPENEECPYGWELKKRANDDEPCWSCCHAPGDDEITTHKISHTSHKSAGPLSLHHNAEVFVPSLSTIR